MPSNTGPTGGTSPDDGTGAGHEASSGGGIQELGTSLIYNARLALQSTGTAGRARGTARTEDSAGSGTADGATVCANRGDRPVRRAALQACAALHASVAADSNDDRDNDDDDDDDIREDDEDEDSRASQEEGLARHIDYSNDDGNDEADFDESEVCKHVCRALPCQAVCVCRARVLRVCRSCVHACVCASVRASVHLCVDRSVRPSILPIFSMPAQPLARMQDEDEDESDIDSMIDQDDLEDIEEALQAQLDGYDSEISNDGATGPPVYPSIHPSIRPSVCLYTGQSVPCTHANMSVRTVLHAGVHVPTCTCTRAHLHPCMHAGTLACMALVCVCVSACVCACAHVCVRTCMQACMSA